MVLVAVLAAAAQLTNPSMAVSAVGPGTSLADKLSTALAQVNAGNTAAACGTLQDFLNEVRAQSGKKLTVAQAQQFTSDTTRILARLGC